MNDDKTINQIEADLRMLCLPFMAEHHGQLAAKASNAKTASEADTRKLSRAINLLV